MKTEFDWHPNGKNAPCYKGKLCKHHRPNNGQCRNTCESFALYKKLGQLLLDSKSEENLKEKTDRVRRYT